MKNNNWGKWMASAALAAAVVLGVLCWREKNVGLMLWTMGLSALAFTIAVPRGRNTFLFITSLSLSLAIAETVLALHNPVHSQTHFDPSSGFVNNYWYYSDIGGQPRPGVHTARSLDEQDHVVYDVTYSIGSDGFRITPGAPATVGKKQIHINFFGCSFTFGEGLQDRQTLPYFAQAEGHDITVKNYGVSGYGVHQALAIMQSDRHPAGDVNFLLTAPWHADRSACIPSYAVGSPRYRLDQQGQLLRAGFCGGNAITKRSAIVSSLKTLMHYGGSQDQQIALYLAIIKQMAVLSKERDQTFVIGFIKADQDFFEGSWSNDKIVAALRQDGITVIDMTLAATSEQTQMSYFLSALDKHPSMLANKTRAELLLQYLQTEAQSGKK